MLSLNLQGFKIVVAFITVYLLYLASRFAKLFQLIVTTRTFRSLGGKNTPLAGCFPIFKRDSVAMTVVGYFIKKSRQKTSQFSSLISLLYIV